MSKRIVTDDMIDAALDRWFGHIGWTGTYTPADRATMREILEAALNPPALEEGVHA